MANAVYTPSCGVCKNPYQYRGPEPYLLPCLHSVYGDCLASNVNETVFCTTCSEYFLKVKNNFPVSCQDCLFQDSDACASCTKCTETDAQQRIYFPKDFVTAKKIFLTTVRHFSSDVLCTNRDDGNQAMSWCQKCEAFFCEHCQASHEEMKATRRHVIVSLKILALPEPDLDRYDHQDTCSIHDGYPLELFDEHCEVPVCYKCKDAHKDCNVKPLEEEIKRIKVEIMGVQLNALEEKLEKSKEIETSLKSIDNALEEAKTELGERVKHTFEELRCCLNQREEEIKIQMTQIMDHLGEKNTEKLKSLYGDRVNCETAVTTTKSCLDIPSPSGVLGMNKTVDARNTACLNKALPQVNSKATSVSFSLDGLQMLRKLTAEFGGFYTRLSATTDGTQDSEYMCISQKTFRALDEENWILRARLASQERWHEGEIMSNTTVKPFNMDRKRAHKSKVQVIGDQNLQNFGITENASIEAKDSDSGNRFLNFSGTTSTRPLSVTNTEYWEVHADVDLIQKLSGRKLIFEIGFAPEDAIDKKSYVREETDCVVLYLACCETHNRICVKVRKDSTYSKCFECPLINTSGQADTLKYGILTIPTRKQCIIIDLNSNRILCSLNDINFDVTLWHIFGVFNSQHLKAKLCCVSGNELQINGDKLSLILSAYG